MSDQGNEKEEEPVLSPYPSSSDGEDPVASSSGIIVVRSEIPVPENTPEDPGEDLNPRSASFDPMALLYAPTSTLLSTGSGLSAELARAPTLNNLSQFESLQAGKTSADPMKKPIPPDKKDEPVACRQFLPEQMPTPIDRKDRPNLLKYMNERHHGPMSVLREWVQRECRVRVFLRGRTQIRGSTTGFLVAFDKHWNLCLVDVDEEYRRKRHRKATAGIPEEQLQRLSIGSERAKMKSDSEPVKKVEQVGLSLVQVVKCRRKTETCRRHVAQVVVRGEHVVSVAEVT